MVTILLIIIIIGLLTIIRRLIDLSKQNHTIIEILGDISSNLRNEGRD